jgi:hypothetical protein
MEASGRSSALCSAHIGGQAYDNRATGRSARVVRIVPQLDNPLGLRPVGVGWSMTPLLAPWEKSYRGTNG